jgi:hypothetical protein
VNQLDESAGSLGATVSFNTDLTESNRISFDYSGIVCDIKFLMDTYAVSPTILVVDIEGSEKIILEEKPSFPNSIQTILIELHPHMYGENVKLGIINKISEAGFEVTAKKSNVYLFDRINMTCE